MCKAGRNQRTSGIDSDLRRYPGIEFVAGGNGRLVRVFQRLHSLLKNLLASGLTCGRDTQQSARPAAAVGHLSGPESNLG